MKKGNHGMAVLIPITYLCIIVGCNSYEENILDIAKTKQPVQLEYEGAYEFIIGSESLDHRAKSTGAIRIDGKLLDTPFASCGTTFISPKHAITASHCIEYYNIGETFTIEQYNTENLRRSDIESYAQVIGNWNDWDHANTLTNADGYEVISYTECSVTRSCSSYHGEREDCPFTEEADIAMVFCNDRPDDAPFVESRNISENGKNVELFWFHEVADLTTTPSNSQYWIHYGKLDINAREENWHYAERQQLLPLVSESYKDGTPYRAFLRNGTQFNVETPVCHGASGSGVFERGTNIFLGPAVTGWGSIVGRLCHDMNISSGNSTPGTGIIHSGLTSQFSELQEVKWERYDKNLKAAVLNIATSV
jgi:hypothetical protein